MTDPTDVKVPLYAQKVTLYVLNAYSKNKFSFGRYVFS